MENLKEWHLLGTLSSKTILTLRNGDVNSYIDFDNAINKSGVDTTMIARGAIIKPWIFEEIQSHQHIDKSATERLEMLKQFAHWGLEHWVHSPISSSLSSF
jgi:tRNA-dihydrouridine synthase 3